VANLRTRKEALAHCMKYGLKRPFQTYLIHGLWIVLTFYYSTTNSSEFGQWILRLMTVIGTVSLIHMIIKRNYFEVADGKLIINRDYFRNTTIDLDKIEKIDIEPGPFSSSKIILKDKTTIKYLDNQVNDKELKELMEQFNIPVE
jgi:hypothetical protein